MPKAYKKSDLQNLPACAAEFINLVIRKMRYRRKVRQDVQAELAAHFEDELKDCATDEEKEQKAQQLIAEFGDVKLLAVLMRRAKKRCRPLWRKALVRAFQALGIIFLYLLLCASPLMIGKPIISVNYVGWLNEFVRQGRDEVDNARPYYEKAVELYVEMPDWLTKSKAEWPTDFNDVQLNSLSAWLEDNKPAIEMLREGSQRPHYWNSYESDETELFGGLVANVMGNVMEPLSEYKHLARAMQWQIRLEAYNGNVDSALRDCAILQRIGDHLHGQGLLVEQLVGVAIEALAHQAFFAVLDRVDVTGDVLKSIQQDLQNQFSKQAPVISVESEKVFWYDMIQRSFTDDGTGGGRALKNALPLIVGDWNDGLLSLIFFNYPDRREVTEMVDIFFREADLLSQQTPLQVSSEDSTKKLNEASKGSLMLQILAPAYSRINQMGWRMGTSREALLAVLAIIRYEKDKGRYPANLNELVATGYLNKLPMDPYSGGPLVYKTIDDDFLLYSFGTNLKDDGGKLGHGRDGKPRIWVDNGDAVFWPVLESNANQ